MKDIERGDIAFFQPADKMHRLLCRIISGPDGRHKVFTVKANNGEKYTVPVVLLELITN